jgi:CubicO group peptidase (beta-lactamase class C family)
MPCTRRRQSIFVAIHSQKNRIQMKTKILLLGFALLLFQNCIKVNPFINLQVNPNSTPLETLNLISETQQKEITDFIEAETRFDACVALSGDKLIYHYGDKNIPYNCASVRKSIFSALYGIAEGKGIINLDATLRQLGVNDSINPLTETEQSATIRHLLTARSGIYLPALGESEGMKRRKPARGQYLPNEHFYYNNWDFNALPIILERITGKKIGELIHEWIAVPIGMRDFTPQNVTYQYGSETEYPQTRVYISAEDLARFSSLYLTQGKWQGVQIVPEAWVETSVQAVSHEQQDADLAEHPFMEGYAYLWWIDEDEQTFWADGAGGHFAIIDKAKNLVVVVRNNTGVSSAGLVFYNTQNPYEPNETGNEVYKTIKSKL